MLPTLSPPLFVHLFVLPVAELSSLPHLLPSHPVLGLLVGLGVLEHHRAIVIHGARFLAVVDLQVEIPVALLNR